MTRRPRARIPGRRGTMRGWPAPGSCAPPSRGGDTAIGLWASIPSPLTAEAAAAAGADYVVVDQQHGAVEPERLMGMLTAIQAGGSAPLVRVAHEDPFVDRQRARPRRRGRDRPDGRRTPTQAARAVAACRYAPAGVRSYGPAPGRPRARLGPAGGPQRAAAVPGDDRDARGARAGRGDRRARPGSTASTSAPRTWRSASACRRRSSSSTRRCSTRSSACGRSASATGSPSACTA